MEKAPDIPRNLPTREKIEILHKYWDSIKPQREVEFEKEQKKKADEVSKQIVKKLSEIVTF